jgi:hypothetical protein
VIENEQLFDWFGNSVLFNQQPLVQFNSELERTLKNVSINSKGVELIYQAVNKDIDFMRTFATVEINISVTAVDRISINLKVIELDTKVSNIFNYIWDSTEAELTIVDINSLESGTGISLNNTLNFDL